VTVLTLALGIGATLAMFGVLHDIYLKPLPFPEPNRLVVGRTTVQGHLNPWVTGADYYDFRDQSTVFSGLGAILPYPMDVTVSGAGEAERASANVGSPNLFGILGVVPRTGRLFRAEDGLEGAADVVILTHETWLRRFGGDPSVVGSALDLDGDPYTVVGILPEGFFFMSRADLWIPMRPDRLAAASRDMHNWYLVGRLRPGVTLDQAQAGVDVVAARLADAWPETNRNKGLLLTELHRVLTEEVRTRLLVLSLAVGLVLLIASANGAAILLARAPARSFEISIRAAMGAPRLRLLRQLMAESLGLALAGGLLGTGLAVWLRGVILRYLAMERLGLPEPSLSFPLLGAAVGLSLMTGLASGLYPAWCSARVPVQQGLKAGNRGFGDAGSRFRSGLVIIQVALSVLLLAGSGVLLRSLANLQGLDPGFDSRDLLTAEVQIPAGRYPDAPSRNRYFQELLSEVQALPGVESASLTSHLPIGDPGNIYRAHAQGDGEDPQRVFLRSVYPGFFETLGIPLLEGRDVEGDFRNDQSWVVILGRTAADRLFPGEDPLGKVVELQLVPTPRPMEVVGVVGDARLTRLEEAPEAALYVPYAQRSRSVMRLAIRTRTPPERVAGALREIVSRLDPEVPLSRVATLSGLVRSSLAERRVMTLSLTLLALLPLVLAAVGLFAVLAYHVSRRSHEIGVRMALGAAAPQVGGMVLVQGMRLAGVGAALGLGGAVVGTRLLRGLLFGVGANDPLTLVLVTGLVLAVATLACAVPVWRAVGSDPRVALAAE
jgi:putative ABC transport system permease protein